MSDFDLGDYKDVATRIAEFREQYPDGRLQPWSRERPYDLVRAGDQTFVVYVAAAYRTPDDALPGVGVAWELVPGKTPYTKGSEVMNAETSAWGRALVAAGIADAKKVASLDEVQNAQARRDAPPDEGPAPKWIVDAATKLAKDVGAGDWVKAQHFPWPYTLATCNEIAAASLTWEGGAPASSTDGVNGSRDDEAAEGAPAAQYGET